MVSFISSRGDLFGEFDVMRREMDSLLASAFGPASIRAPAAGGFPALNISTSPDSVDVYVLAPGVDPQKLDVAVEGPILTISGERPADAQSGKAHIRERFAGPFRRAVTLTDDVDPERVDARYVNGILHISLARKSAAQARRIEVK
jgi:HSP20 family protein